MNETKCDVIFVNSVGASEHVYYSGQRIAGSVVVSIYDKQEIKGTGTTFSDLKRKRQRRRNSFLSVDY